MNLLIRRAVLEDADEISQLASSVTREHIGPSLGKGGLQKLLDSMTPDATRERLAVDWHLTAWRLNTLVGVVVVRPASHLFHLFVKTQQQGQGVGTMLFDCANDHALLMTGSPLATVNASLNAVPVYERWGFCLDGAVVDKDGVRYQPMRRKSSGEDTPTAGSPG